MIEQLSVFLENRAGRLAEMARTLGDAGINMRTLVVADTAEFGVARVICDRPHTAKATLEQAGFGVTLTPMVAVQVPDRPGGLADVLDLLGERGVNVEYAYCFVPPEGDTAVDILRVEDVPQAADVLEAEGLVVLSADSLYAVEGS